MRFLFYFQNTNDHSPLFSNPLYQVDILENITTGTAVLQVSAQDRDIDILMGLRYSIVSGNNLERFFIDAFSGAIYVKSPIDRDPPRSETSFLLTVIKHEIDQLLTDNALLWELGKGRAI